MAAKSYKFKFVGRVLIATAIQWSLDSGVDGRVGLHALRKAENFYRNCGMTDLGPDPNEDFLRYFEMNVAQAAAFRRRALAARLKRWFRMGREVKAKRMLIDGSFVTAKPNPGDLDAVIDLPSDFFAQLDAGNEAAEELYELAATRTQGDLFAVFDDEEWRTWADFFSRVREANDIRKGVVEVRL